LFEGKEPVLSGESNATKENIGLTTSASSTKARSNLLAEENGILLTKANDVLTLKGTLGRNANKDIAGTEVNQNRDVNGNWSCTVKGVTGKGWKEKFIPAGCTTAS